MVSKSNALTRLKTFFDMISTEIGAFSSYLSVHIKLKKFSLHSNLTDNSGVNL